MKYKNNEFKEQDFIDKNKNIKKKTLGLYFKCMFIIIQNFHLQKTK